MQRNANRRWVVVSHATGTIMTTALIGVMLASCANSRLAPPRCRDRVPINEVIEASDVEAAGARAHGAVPAWVPRPQLYSRFDATLIPAPTLELERAAP
jgi:hypothetical protein